MSDSGLRIPKWVDKALLLVGLGVLVLVIAQYPIAAIGETISTMWPRVAWTPLIALCWFTSSTNALYLLLDRRVRWLRILWIRLVGDSYNALLPLAGFAGEPFKLRQLSRDVDPSSVTTALVRDRIIDNSVGFFMSGLGVALGPLLYAISGSFAAGMLCYGAICGVLAIGGIALVLTRLPGRFGSWLARLLGDAAPHQIPTLPFAQVAKVTGSYFVSRALGLLEKFVLLWTLGLPHDLLSIIFVDGFLCAAGYLGFMIPGGLGVFEGGAVYVLGLLGASGPQAIAFALARRGRMMAVGLFGIALHVVALVRGAATAGRRSRALAAAASRDASELR